MGGCYLNTARLIVVAVLVILAAGGRASALAAHGGGPAFMKADSAVDMGGEWLEMPLHHDEAWAQDVDLAVTLDQHLHPLLLPLIRKFAKEQGLKIASQEGTCGISAGLLSKKHVDIGGFCCPPGEMDRLSGLQYHTLGIAALGILVNAGNRHDDLDVETIRNLFAGNIKDWSEVPPAGDQAARQPVRVLGRFHCRLRPGHWRLILDNEELFSLRAQEVGSIEDMISAIADLPLAIGYEVLWNINRYKADGKIKFLRVGGADPSRTEDVATARYPFYRVYNVTTWKQGSAMENRNADALVRYLFDHLGELQTEAGLVSADRLRAAGWQFDGSELVAAPAMSNLRED